MLVVPVVCEYCQNDLSTEKRFRLGGRLVCAPCAQQQTAGGESDNEQVLQDVGFDALAAAVSSRRPGTIRKSVKKKSGMPVGLISFAVATLSICGVSLYVVQSGMLKGWMGPSGQAVSVEAQNHVIKQYNGLVAEGNQFANARQYPKALQKFREAHAVASALPAVRDAVNLKELDGVIVHYESLAQAKPQAVPTPNTATVPVPANIQFMDKGQDVAANDPPAESKTVSGAGGLFGDESEQPKVAAKSASKPHGKEEPTRIDAYKKR